MEVKILASRSELTAQMTEQMKHGLTCYRVRVACKCKPQSRNPEMYPRANQRNGVLVIEGDTVKVLYIRCKGCAAETETEKKE